MILTEDGHLNFNAIERMTCKELEEECLKFKPTNALLESTISNHAIPLEEMRRFTKIMFLKKQKEKYGYNF